MTDIVLIQPPVEDFYFTYKRSIPYGLASIAASLQKHGFSVEIVDCLAVKKSKIIDMPQEMDYLFPYYGEDDLALFSLFHKFRHYGYSYEHAGKTAGDKKPFLVGISSLFTPYCHAAEKTAQIVKKFLPECKIVMGGHHPTVLPHEVMRCAAVDFILRGEGEISMPLLAKFLSDRERFDSIEDIPGIVFRKESPFNNPEELHLNNADAYLHISEPAWIDDFSELPPPAMELVNHSFYSRSRMDVYGGEGLEPLSVKRGSTVVVAGRGCPMPCSYCSVGASSSHGRFRQRRVVDVITELALQYEKYDIGFIDFEDENLTLNRRWFLDLMSEIIGLSGANQLAGDSLWPGKNKISGSKKLLGDNRPNQPYGRRAIELRAMNGLYPPSLDEEMILAMKAAGFKTLNLSLGSTSAEQLHRFRRPDVRKSFEKVLSIAERHSMETVSYIIAGAPDQSPEDSLDDLLFLAQKRTLVGLSIFYPAPGSLDYEQCRQRGLLPDHLSLMRSSALPINHTTSRLQAVTLLRLARVLNFMKSLTERELTEREQMANREAQADICRSEDDKSGDIDLMHGKREVSIRLLNAFLKDGRLRGVRHDGTVFEHNVDAELCTRFASEVRRMRIISSS